MDTQSKKRFPLAKVTEKLKLYLSGFIGKHKLEEPIRKDNFYLPDDTNLDAAERFLVAFAEYKQNGTPLTEWDVAGLLQRVVYMSNEIGSLKRTNRNLRSKNLRLRKRNEVKVEQDQPHVMLENGVIVNPRSVHIPVLVPSPEMKQLLLRTKHLDRTDGCLPGGGYQPLPDPSVPYDANGKACPRNPPKGR